MKGLEGQQLEPSGRNLDGTDCAQLDADKGVNHEVPVGLRTEVKLRSVPAQSTGVGVQWAICYNRRKQSEWAPWFPA